MNGVNGTVCLDDECLARAAAGGDLLAVTAKLDAGDDPNELHRAFRTDTSRDGNSKAMPFDIPALVHAVANNRFEAVELLLDRGADPDLPDSLGVTALMVTAQRGLTRLMRLLMARGASNRPASKAIHNAGYWYGSLTAFHFACSENHLVCVEELVNAGCDITAKSAAGETGAQIAERKEYTMVHERLQFVERRTEKRNELINDAVRAVISGAVEPLTRLLDAGADVNAYLPGVNGDDLEVKCPILNFAATNGHLEVMQLLLDRGADQTLTDTAGITPLMAAIRHSDQCGHLAVLALLLEHNTVHQEINKRTGAGWTAFHFACSGTISGCVDLLVRAGCDTTILECKGYTGQQIAEQYGNSLVLVYLATLAKKEKKNRKRREQRRRAQARRVGHDQNAEPVPILQSRKPELQPEIVQTSELAMEPEQDVNHEPEPELDPDHKPEPDLGHELEPELEPELELQPEPEQKPEPKPTPLTGPMAAFGEAEVQRWLGTVPGLTPAQLASIRAKLAAEEYDGEELVNAKSPKTFRRLLRGSGAEGAVPLLLAARDAYLTTTASAETPVPVRIPSQLRSDARDALPPSKTMVA
jgi:ankyrin repeat protein